MAENKLCILLDSLLSLLETNNSDRAVKVIPNAVQRIDKNAANNAENNAELNSDN